MTGLWRAVLWLLLFMTAISFIVLYDIFSNISSPLQLHLPPRSSPDSTTEAEGPGLDVGVPPPFVEISGTTPGRSPSLLQRGPVAANDSVAPGTVNIIVEAPPPPSSPRTHRCQQGRPGGLHGCPAAAPEPDSRPEGAGAGNGKRRGAIVYSCNKVTMCGGWADRQKGIVTAYVLSAMLDRRFKLDMPRPCDVSVYLAPNEVNWVLDPTEVANGSRSDIEGIDSHGFDLVGRMMSLERLNISELEADFVFVTWNMELVRILRTHRLADRLPWLASEYSLGEVYHYVLNKLFKPTPKLQTRLDELQQARPQGTKLACAQIRMGGSQDFKDSETFNTLENLQSLVDFFVLYDQPSRYRILFASDSVRALELGRTKFPHTFMETSGPITHVDKYQGEDACAGFGRTILDQLTLASCDVLVISESGLGKMAAFLRGTDDDLYLFYNSRVSSFSRELPFPHRPFW